MIGGITIERGDCSFGCFNRCCGDNCEVLGWGWDGGCGVIAVLLVILSFATASFVCWVETRVTKLEEKLSQLI